MKKVFAVYAITIFAALLILNLYARGEMGNICDTAENVKGFGRTVETQEVTCTISDLEVVTETNTEMDIELDYGYGYLPYEGEYGYGLSYQPVEKQYEVTKHLVVLRDIDGTSLRFRVSEQDYKMLTEGETVTIKMVTEYTSGAHIWSRSYYLDDTEIIFDKNVTDTVNKQHHTER